MKALPPDLAVHQRTREFSESTVPAGLRRRHTTRPGVWGRICVLEGSLRYRILEPLLEEHVLSPGREGVVEPEVAHEVELLGAVRFYVEFLGRTDPSPQPATLLSDTDNLDPERKGRTRRET